MWYQSGNLISIVSNAAQNQDAVNNDTYWNAATFGPDSEVYLTRGNSSTLWFYLGLRLVGPPAFSVTDGYMAYYLDGTGIFIFRIDNGGITQVGSTVVTSIAVGDAMGFEVIGDQLSVYSRVSGVWGSALGTETDATYSAAGNIGFGLRTTGSGDDFGGGTIGGVTPSDPIGTFPTARMRSRRTSW